jgi:vacuolar-type H+-ATPase subunit F/Vma7
MNTLLVVSSSDARRAKLCSIFSAQGYSPRGLTESEVYETLPPTNMCVVDASKYTVSVLGTLRRALAHDARIVLVREDLADDVADVIQVAAYMAASPLFDHTARIDEPDRLMSIVDQTIGKRAAA